MKKILTILAFLGFFLSSVANGAYLERNIVKSPACRFSIKTYADTDNSVYPEEDVPPCPEEYKDGLKP